MVTWVSVALGRAVWLVCAGSGVRVCVCVCVCVCLTPNSFKSCSNCEIQQ